MGTAMTMTITLTVPVDPGMTSPNRRLHWAERNRRNEKAALYAFWAWNHAGCPWVSGPVVVSVHVRRGRIMDDDNLWAGFKPIRDALFKHRITPDDSPRWVTQGTLTQETGRRWVGREECVITVEEVAS